MPIAPEAEAPTLHLPDWLPPRVREQAIKLDEPGFREDFLVRLVSDQRMNRVWAELGRRQPECGKDAWLLDPCDPQSLGKIRSKLKASITRLRPAEAQGLFFRYAFFYAATKYYGSGSTVIPRSKLNKLKAPYAQAAENLEALAKTLRSLRFEEYADKLEKMAPNVMEGWREPGDIFWVVERRRTRGQSTRYQEVRRYIAELANFNRIVFGNVLYGTVATVTNVAFDLQGITGAQVREILRAPPTPVI
jgi:hypothetical protein